MPRIRALPTIATMMVVALPLAAGGCSDESPVAATSSPSAAPSTAASAPAAPPAGTGVIEARVTYAGAPDIETLRTNKDVKQCGTEARIEKISVGEHHELTAAVVSVRDVDAPGTSRTYTLDQHGCEFRPHVVAMAPGEIEIKNSDGILHNIHTYSKVNPPINKAQPKFKKVMTESFTKPEVIRATCDVHSWMQGWIVVIPHPFGVTDADGVTRIEGVPPGTHTVDVWHEELGKRSEDVVVKAGETTKVVFAYPKKKG